MRKEIIKKKPLWVEAGGQRYHLLTGTCHTKDLLYELPKHQAELEMQNEELLSAYTSLEESRDYYAKLYDFAPVGYVILTHDGLIDEINSAALDLIGVERKKILHRQFSAFVTAADADHWQLFFSDAKKHCERQNTWLTLKHSDGTAFPVQMDCRRVINADKNPVLYISLTVIAASQLAEKTLHNNDAHALSMVLASAGMGAWNWDIATGRVIFNERWAKLRGYRLEEIEPHVDTWENGIYPDDFPVYEAALKAHLENRTPFFQVEYRVRSLSGPLVWILNRGIVIKRDAEGNPLQMAGIEMDIIGYSRLSVRQAFAAE
jgi:PAS domain S-box-containing protein